MFGQGLTAAMAPDWPDPPIAKYIVMKDTEEVGLCSFTVVLLQYRCHKVRSSYCALVIVHLLGRGGWQQMGALVCVSVGWECVGGWVGIWVRVCMGEGRVGGWVSHDVHHVYEALACSIQTCS